MGKSWWLDLAEILDALRVFPRLLLFSAFWFTCWYAYYAITTVVQMVKNIPVLADASTPEMIAPNALAFRSLCLPREEDFGLPSLGEAFQQAVGNRPGERHLAVIATLQRIDGYALRQMSNENALRAFTPAWQETVQRVANGEPLPERQERLASGVAVNTNLDKHAAREHMALIREMLN